MDAVLSWLSDNRDPLIVGLLLLVVASLGKWRTATRRWRDRRRVTKEQKMEWEEKELERRRVAEQQKEREEERKRCLQRFLALPSSNWEWRPETDAGKIIVGCLLEDRHWEFMTEKARGDVVDLEFAVKATLGGELVRAREDEGNPLGPGERAARSFHSNAEVTRLRFVDDPYKFGSALHRYVLVRIRVSKVPD